MLRVIKGCDKSNREIFDLGRRVMKLENSRNDNVNDIFQEAEERKRREKSIIGYNIPESEKNSGTDRQLEDNLKFIQLLPEQCRIRSEDVIIHRYGKTTEGRIRPVIFFQWRWLN